MSISPRELGAILGQTRLPAILQAEVAECGLACVAMVASYHGSRIELGELRRRFPTSSKGVTLQGLMALARKLKLDTRAIKLDLASVKQLILPCILHWDLNHFVVLRSVNRKSVTVHDPAVGERTLSLAEFGKHFSGVALELSPSVDFRPVELGQKVRFGDVLGRVVGLRRGAAQVIGLALALELVAICMPFQLQWVIDQALLASDMDLVATLSVGFFLLVVLQAAIFALRGWLIATLSTHLNFQWLGNVFAHLLKLPIPYFERRHLGAIQSYFGSVTHMQRSITTGFTQVAVDGVLVIGTSIVMLLYSVRLSLIAATALMIYVAVKWLLFKRLRDATEEEIVCGAKQHTHFLETVRGIQGVRLFGRDDERRMGWMNMLAEQFNAHLRIEKIELVQRTANVLVFGVERVLIVWLASVAVMRTELTLGMLFAFMAYKEQFTTRMSALADKAFEFSMLRVHMERISDIVLTEPDQEESEKEFDLGSALPSIELRRISFRYSPTDELVLDGVDLRIEAGECVAITGASGSGKTTLTKILLGLFPPTSGDVLLDGIQIKRVGTRNYRSLIGTVMQDDVLYTGSIADNISFFDPVPDMGHILNCASMAAIHDEIEKMPMGYDSLVGDIGTGLSGGQRQRILLARALYRRPKILVLDEASSHLDISSERRINDTIRSMKLTRILIAHRPETIAMADRVVVLEGGSVRADVGHESVLKRQTAVLDAARSQGRLGEC